MRTFEFKKPSTVSEAAEVLTTKKAAALAGGTDLIGVLREELLPESPDCVVSLKGIDGLDYIKEESGDIKIGAMATLTDIIKSPLVNFAVPALADAAKTVATPTLRNAATIGGNVCQDVRCWYYRYPDSIGGRVDCARKEDHRCFATFGENRYHSIFGSARVGENSCTDRCPAHTDIPAYLERLRADDLEGAAEIILDVNPMPALTSRVCAHFCMEGCNRGTHDESVNIGSLERYVGDFILENSGKFMAPPKNENGKKAAIIGGGPSGLTAAYFLRKMGYAVTIYERMKEAGGCLMYAIPAFRLPKDIVRKFVKSLEDMGVTFRCGVTVGEEGSSLEDIYNKYDSVMLDTGTWKRPLIGISGEELTRFGLDFLVDVNNYIHERPGADVVVVGGGNVAVDVAITAKRLGAPKVSMVCLESREGMPAGAEEIERVIEEGVELHNGWGPLHITKEGGNVRGIEFKRCTSVLDETGRFNPKYDENETMAINADVVLMAIGQKADLDFLQGSFSVETERGRIKAVDGNATSVPGIFAGGDVTTGPATVIQAIAAGKNSAKLMADYMGGAPEEVSGVSEKLTPCELHACVEGCSSLTESVRPKTLSPEERDLNKEDTAGFTHDEMKQESSRCMDCGCVAVNPSDMANILIALDAVVKTNKRTVTAYELFTADPRIEKVLKRGELILEISVPKPSADTVVKYDKFRLREAVDFAIAALASSYTVEKGVITAARLVFGGVAPIPMRMKKAEEFLVGKKLNADTMAKAADIALEGALPLSCNEYKVTIAKALVRRSI